MEINSLIETVYPELRRFARILMASERPNHTLQPTAVVHEAALKLLGLEKVTINNLEHFFFMMVHAMRQVLIGHARRRLAAKRAGTVACDRMEEATASAGVNVDEIILVEQLLDRLEAFDKRAHKVLCLRFYAGLSIEETAALLELSVATINRDWEFARTWLYAELSKEGRLRIGGEGMAVR